MTLQDATSDIVRHTAELKKKLRKDATNVSLYTEDKAFRGSYSETKLKAIDEAYCEVLQRLCQTEKMLSLVNDAVKKLNDVSQ